MSSREIELNKGTVRVDLSVWLGAVFLTATSAIGPGFLTQMSVFTASLRENFGFVILIAVLVGLGAQLNIWRVLTAAGLPAQTLGNRVFPGAGYVLSALMVIGGLAFNIGNIAGAGLGMNVVFGSFGVSVKGGTLISGVIAIIIFLLKNAGRVVDRAVQLAGVVMIILVTYVMISSHPPVGEALLRTVAPTKISFGTMITLIGGTVGGFISFAGIHRLLDAGITPKQIRPVTWAASGGLGVLALMRVLFFFAVLGVVTRGAVLDPENPPASAFLQAAGQVGYIVFGVVMWCAAISSVIGAAYTSVSFVTSFHAGLDRNRGVLTTVFIAASALIFVAIGKPVQVLIVVGALNGLILPFALLLILIAAHRRDIIGHYRQPIWLTVAGAVIAVAVTVFGVQAIVDLVA